jgi:hypothetical protein
VIAIVRRWAYSSICRICYISHFSVNLRYLCYLFTDKLTLYGYVRMRTGHIPLCSPVRIGGCLRLLYIIIDWYHRISIPAYAIEQQWWQLGVSKNEMPLMSFIFKMMLVLYQSGLKSGVSSNIYWHASKWSSISFSHWQCPSDREFSFPRFVGLLILSLWLIQTFRRLLRPLFCSRQKASISRLWNLW